MTAVRADSTLLAQIADGLRARFGDRIDRLVLYGSRARGDARPDSDYDLALFLKDDRGMLPERELVMEVTDPILEETGIEINVLTFRTERYEERSLLMHEIRKDGVPL